MSRDRFSVENSRPKFVYRAVLLYGAIWITMTAAVAFAVIALVDGEESVTLPPVRATGLTAAAGEAGCTLRRGDGLDPAIPVSGAAGEPAAPGFYEDRPPAVAVVGALRRGAIVFHYRPDLSGDFVSRLRHVQRTMPASTVVVPNVDMRFAVAATAWQRLLACQRLTDGTLDALRLFLGRYVGRGAAEL